MPILTHKGRTLTAAIALTLASGTHASMGNIGTTYGIMPMDVGTAQGLSLFHGDISSAYYNPANLIQSRQGELTVGLMHVEPELRAEQLESDGAPERDGDVLQNDRTQQVLIGLKTDLSDLTTVNHPIYFALIAGVEKYGRELMAFGSEKSEEGQFLEYGREPLFLNASVGTQVWRGISVGAGARITLHADANLDTTTTLGGTTSEENLQVEAKPHIRPLAGLNIDLGETICPDGCFMDNFGFAASFRGESDAETVVDAMVAVDGITPPGEPIPLFIQAIDSYQPEIYSAGFQYNGPTWRVGLSAEWQRWSRLERKFREDTVKNDGEMEFQDIVVPRLGVEYKWTRMFSLFGGLSYEESPLESTRNPEVNYIDNDRYVLGLGGKYTICPNRLPLIAHPVTIGFGYQYQHLDDREFEIVNFEGNPDDETTEVVNTDGHAHVFTGSLTFRF